MLSSLVSSVSSWFFFVLAASSTFVVLLSLVTYFAPRKGAMFYSLRKFTFFFLTYLVSFPALPVFLFRPMDVDNMRLYSLVGFPITKIIGITWELRNAHYIKTIPGTTDNYKDGAIMVANHQSEYDALGVMNIWKYFGRFSVVMKRAVFWVFPFGLATWLAGVIYINRTNGKESLMTLQEHAANMREQKRKILLYPEGTRNKKMGTLLPFKKGAFRIAIAAQCPIIPFVYSPYYFMREEERCFERGRMIIEVLPPIQTKGLDEKDLDKLVTDVRQKMYEAFSRLYKESTGKDCPPDDEKNKTQ